MFRWEKYFFRYFILELNSSKNDTGVYTVVYILENL